MGGVSRTGDYNPGSKDNAIAISHNACSGGGTTGDPRVGDPNSQPYGPLTPPPADARICNGMYVESNNDGGVVTVIDTYPKQPFNFAGRTGRVVFDVSNDDSGSHGAWPEFVITDEPVPGTISCVSGCMVSQIANQSRAKNEIGFTMAGGDFTQGQTGIDNIFYTKNGVYTDGPHGLQIEQYNTITSGCLAGHSYNCPTTKMNHYEVQVSTTRIDIYGTDAGSTVLKHLAGANIAGGLNFSQGLVWMNDTHYNAHKAVEPDAIGTQYDHSFAWDNLGFDGPKTYRDLGYDVPLNTEAGPTSWNGDPMVNTGYELGGSTTWSLPGVTWQQTPTKAKVVFNVWSFDSGYTMSASLNGHAAVSTTIADGSTQSGSIDLPAGDAIQGTNSLKITSSSGSTIISNISLIMVAGAPVP